MKSYGNSYTGTPKGGKRTGSMGAKPPTTAPSQGKSLGSIRAPKIPAGPAVKSLRGKGD